MVDPSKKAKRVKYPTTKHIRSSQIAANKTFHAAEQKAISDVRFLNSLSYIILPIIHLRIHAFSEMSVCLCQMTLVLVARKSSSQAVSPHYFGTYDC